MVPSPDGRPVDANEDGIYSPDELIAAGLTEEIGLNPDFLKTPTDDGEAAAEGEPQLTMVKPQQQVELTNLVLEIR
jgi:hypothetical protein